MATTITPIRITGQRAAELARAAAYALSLRSASAGRWESIRGIDRHDPFDCERGCTIMARRRGCITQFKLWHSSTYGCDLGRSDATREVRVSVAPKG